MLRRPRELTTAKHFNTLAAIVPVHWGWMWCGLAARKVRWRVAVGAGGAWEDWVGVGYKHRVVTSSGVHAVLAISRPLP